MADWDIMTEGLRFPEGPVACADGSVIVTEIEAGRIEAGGLCHAVGNGAAGDTRMGAAGTQARA